MIDSTLIAVALLAGIGFALLWLVLEIIDDYRRDR